VTEKFARIPTRVAAAGNLGALDLRVYIAIAGHANGDGKAYPSLARIAALTGAKRKNIPRSISRLEDASLLRRSRRQTERGGWDRSTYEIIFAEPVGSCEISGSEANRAADAFDAFWRIYPSRSPHENPKKPAALKFEAAVKRGIDPEVIIAGAKRYAAYAGREIKDCRYVKTAVTWLNQEQWNEQYGPPKPAPLRAGMI
jgi:hypothetical protein